MSFLSIAFLAALPLIAAPLVLHLFDRRRNVEIEWGAMQFLMEAATRKTSARRFKQYLLLLLRMLAIAALIFALARPIVPGHWFGAQERQETIFVIDNSMSMMRARDATSLFEKSIEQSIEKLNEASPGDAVRVLVASPYPVWATTGNMRMDAASRLMIESLLQKLTPTRGRSDLLSALMTAVQAELEPTQKRRRIVVFSDGQANDWHIDDENGWRQFREVLKNSKIPIQLDVVQLDTEKVKSTNVAVNHVQSNRQVVGMNQIFSLSAEIQNHGQIAFQGCTSRWIVPGEEAHEVHVSSLESEEKQDVVWKHSISKPGIYPIQCQIDVEDELVLDNTATCIVEVVERVPIVLVENDSELDEVQRDTFFMQAALGWVDGEPLDEPGVFVPSIVSPRRLESRDITSERAIVIPNLTELSADSIRKLEEFVTEGGGLWIGLGPRTDSESFNQYLFADGSGLAPLAIDRIVAEAVTEKRKTTINPFVKEHPATQELTNNQQLDTGDVSVTQRFRFVEPPPGQEVSVLLGLTNGEPLAVEKYFGRGRVIVQSIPMKLQWSELAKSHAFVVMVQDWISYLTQPRSTRYNLAPGDPISIHLSDTSSREATLRTPHGDLLELSAEPAGDGMLFRSSRTILPGDYTLEVGLSGDTIPFQVHRDPLESNLSPLTRSEQAMLSEIVGLGRHVGQAAYGTSTQGDPLWPLLLMILIGTMAAELLLSGLISRQRFGSEPISETTEWWTSSSLDSFNVTPSSSISPSSGSKPRTKSSRTFSSTI